MAKRNMSIKGFVSKAVATKSAQGFLAQYREYLISGEVAPIASPILVQIDSGEIPHEEGLEAITNAVFQHMIKLSVNKAEAQLAAAETATVPANKNYIAKLFTAAGNEIDSNTFLLPQDAERQGERWLVNSESGCYAHVESLKLRTREGKPFITIITREDAFARQYRTKKGPVMKGKPVSTNRLGFGVHAKQDHSHFSRG